MKRNSQLAQRISKILDRLNQGERIDIYELANDFNVSIRTIQRDIKERLNFLRWEEFSSGGRYFKLNRQSLGFLSEEDLQRFSNFASISDLFPKIDREFYEEKLIQSIQVKGFQYEDIRHLEKEFNLLKQAIQSHQFVSFKYNKSHSLESKFYKLAPYSLINKNGIWYLIGTDQDKQKTFCFTQITNLETLDENFIPNENLINEIKNSDSISHGNQIPEVIVQVSKSAAPYFLRRNLLPNQTLLHQLEDGGLLLSCQDINEMEIVPLVQYWLPHLKIVSPENLHHKMIEKIQEYLSNNR